MEELDGLEELESAGTAETGEPRRRPFASCRESPLAVFVACASLATVTALQLGFALLLLATPGDLVSFRGALVVIGVH